MPAQPTSIGAAAGFAELTGVDSLWRIASEWSELHARAVGATAFQSPAWLIPWYEVWGRDRTKVVTVRAADGRLIALLPGFVINDRLELGGCGVSDYLAPLVDGDALHAACDALDTATTDSCCFLCDVPAEVPWPARDASAWTMAIASTCPAIALPGSVGLFRNTLPSGLRRNLRRYGGRLFEAHRTELATVNSEHEACDAIESLFALHGMRWLTHGGGIFTADEVRRFHRGAVPLLYRSGVLRLHVLRADDRVIGVQYVLVHQRTALSYIGGFDPTFDRYSPGSLLMAYSIEKAIEEQCATFDLLRGTEAYKYTWGAVDHTSLTFTRAGSTT